jgi:hypothetical protein
MSKPSARLPVIAPGPLPVNTPNTAANCQLSASALESADIREDFL